MEDQDDKEEIVSLPESADEKPEPIIKKAFEVKSTVKKVIEAEQKVESESEQEAPAVEKSVASEATPATEKPKKAWGSTSSEKPVVKHEKVEPTPDEPTPVKTALVESEKTKPVLKPEPKKEEPKKEEKPVKKIDFEITNPDDIKIDDKGQLGFF
ncbi:hypothetical protein D3C87_1403600 [compost metagenome]